MILALLTLTGCAQYLFGGRVVDCADATVLDLQAVRPLTFELDPNESGCRVHLDATTRPAWDGDLLLVTGVEHARLAGDDLPETVVAAFQDGFTVEEPAFAASLEGEGRMALTSGRVDVGCDACSGWARALELPVDVHVGEGELAVCGDRGGTARVEASGRLDLTVGDLHESWFLDGTGVFDLHLPEGFEGWNPPPEGGATIVDPTPVTASCAGVPFEVVDPCRAIVCDPDCSDDPLCQTCLGLEGCSVDPDPPSLQVHWEASEVFVSATSDVPHRFGMTGSDASVPPVAAELDTCLASGTPDGLCHTLALGETRRLQILPGGPAVQNAVTAVPHSDAVTYVVRDIADDGLCWAHGPDRVDRYGDCRDLLVVVSDVTDPDPVPPEVNVHHGVDGLHVEVPGTPGPILFGMAPVGAAPPSLEEACLDPGNGTDCHVFPSSGGLLAYADGGDTVVLGQSTGLSTLPPPSMTYVLHTMGPLGPQCWEHEDTASLHDCAPGAFTITHDGAAASPPQVTVTHAPGAITIAVVGAIPPLSFGMVPAAPSPAYVLEACAQVDDGTCHPLANPPATTTLIHDLSGQNDTGVTTQIPGHPGPYAYVLWTGDGACWEHGDTFGAYACVETPFVVDTVLAPDVAVTVGDAGIQLTVVPAAEWRLGIAQIDPGQGAVYLDEDCHTGQVFCHPFDGGALALGYGGPGDLLGGVTTLVPLGSAHLTFLLERQDQSECWTFGFDTTHFTGHTPPCLPLPASVTYEP